MNRVASPVPVGVEEERAPLPAELTHEGEVLLQHIREGQFQRALSLIAAVSSILSGLEVTYEHYRGSYSQRIMYSPVILSPALLAAGVAGAADRKAARTMLPAVSALIVADGVIGFVFHIRGINRKPGGWRLPVTNIVMGPPIFAPLLFAISGYLGLLASCLRRPDDPEADGHAPDAMSHVAQTGSALLRLLPDAATTEMQTLEQEIREGRFQKHLATATALAAFFSGFESLYSHYKNDFSNRTLQWSPILLTPLLMASGFGAVKSPKAARTLLPAASALAVVDGAVGFAFHLRGVLRRPGGKKLLLYNTMYGPPVFAPLLFAAVGFLGLLASLLRREK